jgi:hypothetical protein
MKHSTIAAAFLLTLPITGAIVLSIQAQANQIDVSGTPGGSLTFTAAPGNALQVSSDGFQGVGEYRDPSLPNPPADPTYSKGFAQFGPINGVTGGSFLTGPNIGPTPPGVFTPIPPANQLFEYVSNAVPPADGGGALDSLTATITWTKLAANAPLPGEPQLFGTGVVNTSSGDAKFTGDFPVSGVFDIFANFPLTGSCDLTQLALGPPSCAVTFEMAAYEGGDATPGTTPPPPGVPEPMSSSMALGLALFCLWGTYQLTWRERRDHGAPA